MKDDTYNINNYLGYMCYNICIKTNGESVRERLMVNRDLWLIDAIFSPYFLASDIYNEWAEWNEINKKP